MKSDNDYDHYGYMRLTHMLAVCLGGFPITRRKIINPLEMVRRSKHDGDSLVQGHQYGFDLRIVPAWLAYAVLDAIILYYNFLSASQYIGDSFRKCFEESYCFAIIELVNRNVGPMSALACFMFYGCRHKVAALAGTERTLHFLCGTASGVHGVAPPAMATYCSAAVIVAYSACILLYTIAIPVTTMVLYCINAIGQIALYNLVVYQYYVLERGYARVNLLLEMVTNSQDPATARHALSRLTGAHRELGCLVEHLNRAYVPSMLLKWPYSIIRLVMIVFRIIELSAVVRADHHPFGHAATWLIVEHVGEIVLFLFQLSCFSLIGHGLSYQAERTLASLQKLKLCYRLQLDMEIRKMVNIFRIQVNARKVKTSIGGYITINMNFFKAICGVIATYFFVLIQFKLEKGDSKPLHHSWS